MVFEAILFFLAAAGAIGGALGVVFLRNPFFSVLALVGHLLALAVLFLLLRAEFVAAAQVVVYAGAVMVLYVFVVAYVGGSEEPLGPSLGAVRTLGPVLAGALLIEIAIAIVALLLQKYLIAFEAASYLLLVAAVAAVVLASRRRGLEESGGGRMLQIGRRPAHGPQATDRSSDGQGGYGERVIDRPEPAGAGAGAAASGGSERAAS